MKNLILNNPLNGEFKPVKDNDGTTSGLSLAHNKVKAENLEVRNLSGSIYFDEELTIASSGDINLDTDGGQVYIKDGGTDHFLFDCDGTRFRIYDDDDDSDHCTINVAANGVTGILTNDNDGTAGHLQLIPDGDLVLDPASTKVIINATDKLYLDSGGDTYITEVQADVISFNVGGDTLLQLEEHGDSGNAAFFRSACAGFAQIAETFSDDSIIGSGGTHDTHVDFRHSNKVLLALTNDITNLNLIFPLVSGNFQLLLTYDGDHDITNYKVYEYDESAADGDADVQWAGGSAPATTSGGVDIFSFYWDATNEKCYGVGSLNFS